MVFGVNEKAEMPYFCSFYSSNTLLESYDDSMIGDDYVEMMEMFADRVKTQCVKVLFGKLNDVPSGRLFRSDLGFL